MPPRPQAGLVSADGSSVRIVATIEGDADAVTAKAAALRPVLASLATDYPGFEVHALNNTLIMEDLMKVVGDDLDGSLKVTLPATFLILLVAFGAAVAASVPLVLALSALLAGFGILGIYSQLVAPVAMSTSQLVVLIGLAVGVDYSLFMITRFRSERRAGKPKLAAIETASGTAGRAVFFSGLAVAVSLAGLFLIRVDTLNAMAVAMIGVVLVAVIGSLTFLPATLSILGDRVNRGRMPFLGRDRADGDGVWARIVKVVIRRPAALGMVAVTTLLVLASPFGHLRMGATDINSFPSSVDGVAAIKLLNEEWPQGTTLQLQVVVTRANEPATQAAMEALKVAGLRDAGVGEPVTVQPSADGTVARVSFVMPGDQNDPANQATVERFRNTVIPAVFGSLPGVHAYVDGDAALALDSTRIFTDGIPLVFAFVLGLTFLLLLVAFRSIVIPATAIVLNLLSAGAAYGILTLVFQDGWFANAIGITPGPGHRELRAAVHLHDRLRPVDGLPLLHPDPDQGGARPWPRLEGGGCAGHLGHGGNDHQRRRDHGRRLLGLRDHEAVDRPADGSRVGGRRLRGRDGHPEHPPAGGDAPARRLELVPALVPGLAATGHDRGRTG